MFLGRVVGTVVATRKIDGLRGIRLLVVQPVGEDGNDRGNVVVAADTTLAGSGDVVHVTSSREAAVAMEEPFVPVDHAIIAIVDRVGATPLQVATSWPSTKVGAAKRSTTTKAAKRSSKTASKAAKAAKA